MGRHLHAPVGAKIPHPRFHTATHCGRGRTPPRSSRSLIMKGTSEARLAGLVVVRIAWITAIAVCVLVILIELLSGTDGGDSSQNSLQALSAAPEVRLATGGGAQGKSRKTKEPRKTKRPETKSATLAAAVSEPSFSRAPTTKKRSPATIQPAAKPVASSPAPSSSGGGSNDPPPQVPSATSPQVQQGIPSPQVQQGIGGGEAWHGIGQGGG
jgi:hypothetical protein